MAARWPPWRKRVGPTSAVPAEITPRENCSDVVGWVKIQAGGAALSARQGGPAEIRGRGAGSARRTGGLLPGGGGVPSDDEPGIERLRGFADLAQRPDPRAVSRRRAQQHRQGPSRG